MESYAIVPAAGKSRRMGTAKLLLPWRDGIPLIQHVLQQWQHSAVSRIVVVAREDDEPLCRLLATLPVETVAAHTPPPQMRDSVQLALDYIRETHAPANEAVWLLAPADLPGLTSSAIDCVLQAHHAAAPAILVPTVGHERGHPVLFPWALADKVKALPADVGLNTLVHAEGFRTIEFDSATAFCDIDTPEDYRRLRPTT